MHHDYYVEILLNDRWFRIAEDCTHPEAMAVKAEAERHGDTARIAADWMSEELKNLEF